MMGMKKRILLFSLLLFLASLCAGFAAHKGGNIQSFSKVFSKNNLVQKTHHKNSTEITSLSDSQDESDFDDLEKVKYDYTAIVQQYMSFFFSTCSYHTVSVAVRNHTYIAAPRYILYHSLQIAGC